MQTERELRQRIVEIGRTVYERGFIAASDGNISARLDDGTILTTPTMVCKGRMTEDMLVLVDINGRKLGQLGQVPDKRLFDRAKSFRETRLRWVWSP